MKRLTFLKSAIASAVAPFLPKAIRRKREKVPVVEWREYDYPDFMWGSRSGAVANVPEGGIEVHSHPAMVGYGKWYLSVRLDNPKNFRDPVQLMMSAASEAEAKRLATEVLYPAALEIRRQAKGGE